MAATRPPQAPQTPHAAIYVRVSTTGQEDGSSLETQEAACRKYAVQLGYVAGDLYREVHTGTELWERPRLTELRQAIRQHDIAAVVCYAIDRFARDPVHLGVLISEADHHGVAVHFVTEPLDNSPEGQLIRFVRGYAAKVEHEKIRERSMRGKRALVAAGRPLVGGLLPYGYRWRDAAHTHFEVDPVTGPWARLIFEWAAAGVPLRAIAIRLTEAGVPTPRHPGAFWSHTTLGRILANPTYAGRRTGLRYVTTKNKHGGETMKIRPIEDQIALPNDVAPGVVTWECFQLVQERLHRNQQQAARNNPYPEVTLLRAGYARCGHCGSTMCVKRVGPSGKYYHYRCIRGMSLSPVCDGASIPTHTLDLAVWTRVQAILTTPEIVETELARLQTQDPTADDLTAVERSLGEIRRQQRNLVEQLANLGGAVAGLVTEKLTTLERQLERLTAERDAIQGRRETWRAAQHRLAELTAWCRSVGNKLGTLTYAEKRVALEALQVQAQVWRAGHAPRYEISVSIPLGSARTVIVDASSRRLEGRNSRLPFSAPRARGLLSRASVETTRPNSAPPPSPAPAPPAQPRPAIPPRSWR